MLSHEELNKMPKEVNKTYNIRNEEIFIQYCLVCGEEKYMGKSLKSLTRCKSCNATRFHKVPTVWYIGSPKHA